MGKYSLSITLFAKSLIYFQCTLNLCYIMLTCEFQACFYTYNFIYTIYFYIYIIKFIFTITYSSSVLGKDIYLIYAGDVVGKNIYDNYIKNILIKMIYILYTQNHTFNSINKDVDLYR